MKKLMKYLINKLRNTKQIRIYEKDLKTLSYIRNKFVFHREVHELE